MLFKIGLILLFFLPVIESFNRQIAFNLLLVGSIFVSLATFAKNKLSFDFDDLLWFLVLLIFTVTTINSWSLSRSYIELLRYFAYFLIFITVKNYLKLDDLLKRFFVPMVIFNSIVLSSLFIISRFLSLPQPENKMSLFDPFYMGHNHLADILIFAIPIAFFLHKRFLSLVLSLFFLLLLVLTFSRGAMISLSLAFLFYFIAPNLWQKRVDISAKKVLLLISITAIFLISSFLYSNFINTSGKLDNIFKRFYKPAVEENRFEYLNQAWKGFKGSPVLGTGLDTFRYVSKIYQSAPNSWSWYAHNHFIQIFTETGFFGGLLFFILITTLLFRAYKNIYPQPTTHNPQQTAILIAVIASTIHSLIDFDWQYISIFLIFFISTGLLSPQEVGNKKYNFRELLLILVVSVMFLVPQFLKLDSDQLIAEADESVTKNNFDKAKNTLIKAYIFDYKNQEISWRLGDLEAKIGSSDSAHLWYKDAILQDQYYAENIIKNDLRLYLIQAKNALDHKDFKTEYNYLVKSIKAYPLFYQLASGDYFLFNANKLNSEKKTYEARKMLSDYINLINKQINLKKISPEEISFIAANLRQNVY